MSNKKMTPSELKYNVELTGSLFFTQSSMRFFGDTMSNYGVRLATVDTWTRKNVKVWELYRIHPVKFGNQESAYFDYKTFVRVHAKIEA